MLTLALSEARSGYFIEIRTSIRWTPVRLINEVVAVGSSFKAAHGRRWLQGNTPNLFFRIVDWHYRFLGLSHTSTITTNMLITHFTDTHGWLTM